MFAVHPIEVNVLFLPLDPLVYLAHRRTADTGLFPQSIEDLIHLLLVFREAALAPGDGGNGLDTLCPGQLYNLAAVLQGLLHGRTGMRCLLEYHIIKMSLYQSVPQFPLLGQMPAQMYTRMCLHDYFSVNPVFPAEHLKNRGHIIEESMAVAYKQHAEFFHGSLHLIFCDFAGEHHALLHLFSIIQSYDPWLQEER